MTVAYMANWDAHRLIDWEWTGVSAWPSTRNWSSWILKANALGLGVSDVFFNNVDRSM